jgi:hypothetical protein
MMIHECRRFYTEDVAADAVEAAAANEGDATLTDSCQPCPYQTWVPPVGRRPHQI